MPEGHTLHRLAAQIQTLFVGGRWRVSSPQGRFAAGAERLDGGVPQRAEAWGKHLFVHVDPHIWHVHLGLYGAFSFRGDEMFSSVPSIGAPRVAAPVLQPRFDDDGWLSPEPPQGAVRARIRSPHGWADLRGPAICAVLDAVDHEAVIDRLGPDPLRQHPDGIDPDARDRFLQSLSRRRIGIAAALMDQAVISGVGNIYRAESLFLERLNPETPSRELSAERGAALWERLTCQLRDGVAEGIIRTQRELPDRRHWVYQHQGTACLRCAGTIEMRQLQGRRLYWCPGCQGG